jgi:serine/threonine-protein kinase
MALAPATRLGPYEIVSLLGAGGMGEVYQARDTRLQRTVAVKVLSFSHAAVDQASRLERFRREADAVSRLSHPHICSLFDVGEQDGHAFLVMEHLEGETLAARLAQGPLPLERALRYGIDIASALDAAHRQGVVHRDLKPANIMVTRHGVKLLDFGLARLREDSDDVLARSQTADLTGSGVVLGTVPYMAPEHLDGQEADARADIFALGVVIYEMVCGRRPFGGESKARIIAAILEQEPPPASRVQRLCPPVLDHVLARCLAKDPEERWQAARDVAIALGWVAEGGSDAGLPPPMVKRRDRRTRLEAAAVAAVVGAALGGLVLWAFLRPSPPPLRPTLRVELNLDPPPIPTTGQHSVALSPDGSRLAYLTGTRQDHQLVLRALEQSQSMVVPDSDGAEDPFFSPDGQWVAFFAGGSLKKVAVSGGAPLTLCAAGGLGGSWEAEDTLVFSGGPGRGLMQVGPGGGQPRPLTSLDASKGESEHSYGHFLPGRRALLYTVTTTRGAGFNTVLQDLDGGERRTLLEGFDARYFGNGYLVYYRNLSLFAVRFDARRRAIAGSEMKVVDEVGGYILYPIVAADLSASGSFVYASSSSISPRNLVWVDRHGQARPLDLPAANYETVRLSAHGQTAAVTLRHDAWRLDLARGTLTRLTFGAGRDYLPVLSPDDRRVAYSCPREDHQQGICVRAADGSGGEVAVLSRPEYLNVSDWTPDGREIVFVRNSVQTGHDVWTVAVDGERRTRELLASPVSERAPTVSPDGRWLAYASDESGQFEVFVQSFPALGGKVQVSTDGGDEPVWSRAGGELFYRRNDDMMAVSVQAHGTFRAGIPRVLFSGRYQSWRQRPDTVYAVTPDGQRFLMLKRAEVGDPRLSLVVDLGEELKRRLP